ncbi:hypothetical protein OSH08_10280 [Kaistia geumhonensis]|uniref:Heme exporter protein D n=1 Tax=Kaistia geumhonensis TaxID=410839 RepID=A0ABU0M3G8_9HYPH|nr:hypothetical protein [Kaistia geumhonensis]MCX5479392.1 hypothetical protein [Kaistia geumhonensis]MDQ0515385.1 hypothetical protein [Kaistia geumhonensis]
MDYLLFRLWPFMAASAGFGILAGIAAEIVAARRRTLGQRIERGRR